MVTLFPLPGYVSKLQQGDGGDPDSSQCETEIIPAAQKATLKNTDARVQTVSESEFSESSADIWFNGFISDECTSDD
jgi:hypothetical protein